MEFVKDFATFLHESKIIKFGDFTLSSGKKSSYYVDLRVVPSYPHQFRMVIKTLQSKISEGVGLENFDSYVSVPTGGLILASSLAVETIKPLIYVRDKPKEYGTSKSIEGRIDQNMKVLMIDDVATTGQSMIKAIKILKENGVIINDAFVAVDRLAGASQNLKEEGVDLHSLTDILEITESLYEQKAIDEKILQQIKEQCQRT